MSATPCPPNPVQALTLGSLFAGIGGFDLGFERAGFKTIWQVEIDDYCRRVLAKHFPDASRFGDIRDCCGRDHSGHTPFTYCDKPHQLCRVDVIAGGFPCKQTSTIAAVHKRRHGLDGKDSSLWWEYLRIVREMRPTWVVVENVAGVSSWANSITLGLEGLGYGVSKSEYQAADFGAPHARRRLLFVAHLDGQGLQASGPGKPSSSTTKDWPAPPDNLWREHKPGVWRMDDGIPGRVDRIRALGNAVVPQIAEWIARRILEAEARA